MKSVFYLFAIVAGLFFLSPFAGQSIDLDGVDPPGPPPREPVAALPLHNPIMVDAQAGTLTIVFLCEPGKVAVLLQDEATGCTVDEQSIKPDIFEQMTFDLPAGTYILTITKMNGEVILQENNVVIP